LEAITIIDKKNLSKIYQENVEVSLLKRWRYGRYRPNDAAIREAQAWESAKKRVNGLHFLAIQTKIQSYDVEGLWVMQTMNM